MQSNKIINENLNAAKLRLNEDIKPFSILLNNQIFYLNHIQGVKTQRERRSFGHLDFMK